MKNAFNTPEFNNTFFVFAGSLMYQCEITDHREKAVKTKVTSFICYPGVTDNTGRELGFAWLPKSALRPHKEAKDSYTLANWCKVKFTRA